MSFVVSQPAPSQSSYFSPPPQPPTPWTLECDGQFQRWFLVNQQTGERKWDTPQPSYPYLGPGGGSNSGYVLSDANEMASYVRAEEPEPDEAERAARAKYDILLEDFSPEEESIQKLNFGDDRPQETPDDRPDAPGDGMPGVAGAWATGKSDDVQDGPEDVGNWNDHREGGIGTGGEDACGEGDDYRRDERYGDDNRW